MLRQNYIKNHFTNGIYVIKKSTLTYNNMTFNFTSILFLGVLFSNQKMRHTMMAVFAAKMLVKQ